MQKLVCDGCGKSEPLSTPEKKQTIRPVKLSIVHDSRSSMNAGTDDHEADLCVDCQTLMLSTYFRIRSEHIYELPTFIRPVENAAS